MKRLKRNASVDGESPNKTYPKQTPYESNSKPLTNDCQLRFP